MTGAWTDSAAADRSAGSGGAAASADWLAEELQKRTGQAVQRQSYLLTVPVVERCDAWECVAGANQGTGLARRVPERAVAVAPLLPSGAQTAAIAPGRERAEILYAGNGGLERLRGHGVARRFVALEASSPPTAWQTMASLGASAIVFLGDARTPNTDLLNKCVNIPVGIPRFYCDDAEVVTRIRSGELTAMELRVRVTWQEKRVDNLLCFLPGRQTQPGRDAAWTNQLLVLQARHDGASEVMGRGPGATQALNAALLVDLAQRIAALPAHRSVLIALTAGDQWNLRGSRTLLDLLNREVKDPTRAVTILQAQATGTANAFAAATTVLQALPRIEDGDLSGLHDAATREAMENQLLRAGSAVEQALQKARLEGTASALPALEARKNDILSTINALHVPGMGGIGAAQQAQLKDVAGALLPVYEQEVERAGNLRDAVMPWAGIRAAIGARTPMLWLTLALSGGSGHYGFFSRSHYFREFDASGPMSTFAQSFRRYQPANDAAFQTGSLENRFTLETFFNVPMAFSSDAALARGMPAGAFATTQDAASFLDTPNDTVDHIEWAKVGTQAESLRGILLGTGESPGGGGVVTDPLFYGRADLPNVVASQNVTLFERTFGESLPRVPAMETLLGGEPLSNGQPLGVPLAGVQRVDWYLTGAEGSVVFGSQLKTPTVRTRMQALMFDADGLPVRTLATNQSDAHGLASDFSPDPDRPLRAMLFAATRLDAYGLFDPRSLETLDSLDILDARRLDKAEFSTILPAGGSGTAGSFATLFFPPGIRWQMLAGRGSVGNRMLLINADAKHPTGQGYDTTDLAELGPLAFRNALDLSALNTRRERDLERFGVSNDIVKTLQEASQEPRHAAVAAEKSQDYPTIFGATDALWSLQSQVYQQLIDTSNGIIKAVIFLLLALIPFSYFLERLVIGATSVTKQIAWFGVIFLCMTAALAFHPAFRISSAPLMILLAFLILILSSTVVYILWGKFEEEIARLQGAGTAAHSISLRRGAVFGAAVRLGLSNMRRRGMRTALTLVTLILLTFTLLCFTSVREVAQVTPRVIAGAQTPPGILLRQRGWRTLPPESLELARNSVPDGAVAGRWWYASEKAEQPWALPVTAGSGRGNGGTFFASAFVGLDKGETRFQGAGAAGFIPSDGTCALPEKAAELLHVGVGDSVMLLGRPLKVTAVFSSRDLAQMRQLTGDPITPIDPAGQLNMPTVTPSAGAGAASAPETSYRFMSPDNVVLLPADLVRQAGGRLTSIMLRPGDARAPTINALAESLAQRSALTLYVSDGVQTRALNASSSAAPQDFGDVLIPMVIAGVIVLNTMLGAVSERTREIHVYTSVGLAPAHVGMLFLAEAAALGTLGTVAGYIFGQGFATFLSWSHLLPGGGGGGMALNYSSLSAVATMGIVLAIVMLSALWPARAASRVAAPSLRKGWKLPKPVGDLLSVDLPFTVNENAANGVCAFIEEFLLSAGQAGGGRFTADNLHPFVEPTTQGAVRGLTARIWLTPYDLGVIQTMRLAIYPTDNPNVFDVHLDLTREAGNPSTWKRLNRSFLIDLRKQFLLWRNLTPAQTKAYLARSASLFSTTG